MSVLLSLWLVWCVLGGISLIFALKSMARWLLAATTEEVEPDIDRMGWKTFEVYVAKLFEDLGYRVQLTPDGPDYGADVILERENVRTAVQAKQYTNSVSVKAIQQVVAAKAVYGCSKAMVVTTSMYTKPAQYLAQKNEVELWDRPILLREMAKRQGRRHSARLQAQAVHRISSISAVLITVVLLSGGFAGYWRQGFSAFKLSPQPITNGPLNQPDEPGLSGVVAAVEPTDRNSAVEGSMSEDSCGSAVVQGVAAVAIREAPSLQSVAVGEVPQGRSIKLICESVVGADGLTWQLVDYGPGRGWMSRKYLLVEQP